MPQANWRGFIPPEFRRHIVEQFVNRVHRVQTREQSFDTFSNARVDDINVISLDRRSRRSLFLAAKISSPPRFTRLRDTTGMESVVVRDPEILSGAPTFRGTRVLVRSLFDYLEAGHSLQRFLAGFPSVSRDMALQALEEAREGLLASR